jgi:hypothetical protein
MMNKGRRDIGGRKAFFEQAFDQVVMTLEFAILERDAEFVQKDKGARLFHFIGGGQTSALDTHVDIALNVADLKNFTAGRERNGAATTPLAPGSPDAMHVILAVVGEIVVEDHLHVVHVNTARGDIGGDKKIEAGFAAEFLHDAVAHHLGHVPVQAVGGIALHVEMINQVIDHAFGIAENDAQLEVVQVDEAGEQIDFVTAVHLVINLLDRRDGQGLLLDAHLARGVGIFFNQLLDGARDGGGKENGLPLLGRGLEDLFNVVAEPHVEHDINLVKNNDFDRGKLERAAPHMVHDAAGGADDDLGALSEAG